MTSQLNALLINCTLKPSPAESSSELMGRQILQRLGTHGCEIRSETIRAVDHAIAPGVQTDMGEGDEWPRLREQVLRADILVFVTPTWLGQHSSVAQRVLERLDAELSETDDAGRPILFDKIALLGVVGNEDGAHHISAILSQSLGDVGYTIPAQASIYWNGEAMQTVDYLDLPEIPEKVDASMTTATANAVHVAQLLRERGYPALQ